MIRDSSSGISLLIDTGPDLRMQLLREKLIDIDAVLYTHTHADHIFGLDDLRPINFFKHAELDIFGRQDHIDTIRRIFPYAFAGSPNKTPVPTLTPNVVSAGSQFSAAGIDVMPIEIHHGSETILGYRVGNVAYLTDCSGIDAPSMELLQGLDCLIMGALRYKPHPKHFSVDQAVAVAQNLKVKKLVLTHLGHELDYDRLNSETPDWVESAFDGMCIDFDSNSI